MRLLQMRGLYLCQSGADHNAGKSEGSGDFRAFIPDKHSGVPGAGLSSGNDIKPEAGQPDKLYCIDFYSAHVDEFSFKDNGLADSSGKEWCHKQYSELFSSAGSGDHQYSLCHCSWNGV